MAKLSSTDIYGELKVTGNALFAGDVSAPFFLGNASSATILQTARTINGTSFNGSANITTSSWGAARSISIGGTTKSVNGSGNVTWAISEIKAQTAVTLETSRTINGTSFNGSANITTANWGTARTITIGGTGKSVNGSANVTWATSEIAAQTAVTLATARTINGTSFNGSANITTANWGTARTITIGSTGKSVNGSGNVSWTLAEIGAAPATHTHNYAPVSHGNHVPTTQTANNAVFLRNDNTWQTVTPANIGAAPSSHNHTLATQAQAEAGTNNSAYMTALRTKQAIDKFAISWDGVSTLDAVPNTDSLAIAPNHTDFDGAVLSLDRSTLIGKGIKYTGYSNSRIEDVVVVGSNVSLGYSDAAESANGNVIVGSRSLAEWQGTAIGSYAKSFEGVSLGYGSNRLKSSGGGTAIGSYTETSQFASVALGVSAKANAAYATALGASTSVTTSYEGVLGVTTSSPGTRNWKVPGTFAVTGTKNFVIPHPHPDKKDTHDLRHSAVESPTSGDNLYRYELEFTNELVQEMQLPDYFPYLNINTQVWITGVEHFGRGFGKVIDDKLIVTVDQVGKYNILVIGTRNDENVQDWYIRGVEKLRGESWEGLTSSIEDYEIVTEEEFITEEEEF